MTDPSPLDQAARLLANALKIHRVHIVFAESCTAGLVSATLARIPGISEFLCGSAIVYQEATKQAWLSVSAESLRDRGVVSAKVAQQMAVGVLRLTPVASIAASVTGHLGPDAPVEQDGLIYVGTAVRRPDGEIDSTAQPFQLDFATEGESGESLRHRRQVEATLHVLRTSSQRIERGAA